MSEFKMPVTGHLEELRRRIMVSVVSLLTGFLIAFYFSERLFNLLTIPIRSDVVFKAAYPYIELVGKERVPSLIFLAPAEALWVHLKISMIAALVLSLPVILWQLWKFLSPGLMEKERKLAVPFVMGTTGLFLSGVFFSFIVVLPLALRILLEYKTASLEAKLSVERYVDFCLKFMLAFGAVFELPLLIFLSTVTGVVKPETLSKNRKYAVLLAFVAAALLTPTPDALNQTLMAVPIIVLYEAGVLASKLFLKRRRNDKR